MSYQGGRYSTEEQKESELSEDLHTDLSTVTYD